MKKNKRKENITYQSGRLTTSRLLKELFEEYELDIVEWGKGEHYHFRLKLENEEIVTICVDVNNDLSFIWLMVFQWHEVKTADIEEVVRVQKAINRFNNISRAKVYYHVEGDNMQLSTMLHCCFCKEIPNFKHYFFVQLETVLDACEFIFPSGEEKDLPWHDLPVSPQAKISKDIVLDSLKKLNCKSTVELDNENFYSIKFDYQTVPFEIISYPTSGFVKLIGPYLYSFDAAALEYLSAVKEIVNDLNWTLPTTLSYSINEDRYEVSSYAFLTCVEGVDFSHSLNLMLFNYFHSRNMFHKTLAESSAR